jgi:hypothetical protein
LINTITSFDDGGEPSNIVSDVLSPAAGATVVSLPEEEELDEQLNSGPVHHERQIITPNERTAPGLIEEPVEPAAPVADMDIPEGELEGELADDELPEPDEPGPAAVASAKKRGRPSATPAKAKTPRSAASTNGPATASRSTGRKRKAEDNQPAAEATPAKRPRGRPARNAAATASARPAAKSAKQAKRGRPKGSGTVRLLPIHRR